MKSFLEIAEEADKKLKPVVMAFGRMNPPTSGHEKLVNKVKDIAAKHSAPHHIILSHTQDAKKNPLSAEDKVKHAKRAFPNTHIEAASKEHPTFMHHAKKLSDAGHKHLIMVAGSDRVDEYKKILHKYNGQEGHHNFHKIDVVSAGERDPDAEGASGRSATKMREHAKNKNFAEFKKGVPSAMAHHHAQELYKDVRKGMGLHENVNRGMFKAIFITGGPGSGKDIVVREGIAESRIVELNTTQAFDYLMDKKKLSEQSKDFRREAIRNRGPLIITCSADNLDPVAQIKEELEELGYNTMMVYVDTTDSVSRLRNQGLKRMVSEDVRKEKWSKSQQNKVAYYKMFEDFNLFVNNNASTDVIEEGITDVYDHTKDFLNRDSVNDIATDWMIRNGKMNIDEAFSSMFEDVSRCKHGKLLVDNNCTFCQMQRKAGKIDDVRDGDVKSNSDYVFKTYEDSSPTLKVSPEPKIPSFRQDKETDKSKKPKWFNLPSGAIKASGMGREFDTRQQGTVYPMSGMGDVTYRESVEYKYKNEGLAEKPLKSFNSIRSVVGEAIDDPGTTDMGVAGTEGGATNKEPMQTYKDQDRNVGITIKKNKKRGA